MAEIPYTLGTQRMISGRRHSVVQEAAFVVTFLAAPFTNREIISMAPPCYSHRTR